MKNFEFQNPNSRKVPMNKIPNASGVNLTNKPIRHMRLRVKDSLGLGILCLALFLGANSFGQAYSIDWFTIDGGGGTSTGGVYSVSGTIGQPDAGHMSGGNFTIDGGFWGIIAAVQTPGAPLLTILRTTTNTVAVSWPSPSTGFSLQANTNGIGSVNWSNVVTTPSDDGTTKTVIVNPPAGNRFYRLFHP
jgi:hypothetical protein